MLRIQKSIACRQQGALLALIDLCLVNVVRQVSALKHFGHSSRVVSTMTGTLAAVENCLSSFDPAPLSILELLVGSGPGGENVFDIGAILHDI